MINLNPGVNFVRQHLPLNRGEPQQKKVNFDGFTDRGLVKDGIKYIISTVFSVTRLTYSLTHSVIVSTDLTDATLVSDDTY